MKYRIEEFPNSELIEIHITKKIAPKDHISFLDTSNTWMKGHPEELKDLVCELFEVPGVVELSISQYSIRVEKAKAFDWKDMEPALIKVIDVMLATNETLEELPAIRLTSEERVAKIRAVEEASKNFRGFGGFWTM